MRMFGLSHRRLLRAVPAMAITAALIGAGFMQSGAAEASFGWCAGDPLVYVNGKSLAINIGVQGDLATVQADVLSANIVVHVPRGVTTSIGPSGALPFPENVSFVYDKGTYTSGAIGVQIVTTFTLAPKTPSLN